MGQYLIISPAVTETYGLPLDSEILRGFAFWVKIGIKVSLQLPVKSPAVCSVYTFPNLALDRTIWDLPQILGVTATCQ